MLRDLPLSDGLRSALDRLSDPSSGVGLGLDNRVRAVFDDRTVRVYQAFSREIAASACAAQRFVTPPFSMTRMTWIKPSFFWMMYRSGWATKDERQRHVLAIDITHEGFVSALSNACVSSFKEGYGLTEAEWKARLAATDVRLQWDPERDILLRPLPFRSAQIGLRGAALRSYVAEWTTAISDVTDHVQAMKRLIDEGRTEEAQAIAPRERPYLG